MLMSLFVLLSCFCFVVILLLIFYVLMFVLSIKDLGFAKLSSFECGFSSLGKIQNSFSIHFFIIMLMFVIFDLEIVMFIGLMVSDFFSLVSFFMLFVFVLGGFYMEWWYGKLIWVV